MHIANPIYDVVFKYLMSDSKIARLLIGSIIAEDIIELSFNPQERSTTIDSHSLTVYRLDFCATIKTEDGTKQVLIEIQKAKFATDIMRFRKYLGDNYAHKENNAVPIISIYFLGYSLGINAPLIQVKRHYYDVIGEYKEIHQKSVFIESLTHDSYVIQIPHLSLRYQSDLEILLSVFDQHAITSDHHILNVKEAAFPEKYQHIIRRLQQAVAEPEVRQTMDLEDEILEELQDKERLIARLAAEKETAVIEKDIALIEKDNALIEKDDALIEKDNALIEKDNALIEKEKAINALIEKDDALVEKDKTMVINAYQSGLDTKTIQKITQLDRQSIEKIIAEL